MSKYHTETPPQTAEKLLLGINTKHKLTLVSGSETEDIVEALGLVRLPIGPDARPSAGATTRATGDVDGVLHRAVTQPAGIAPVQTVPPGLVELLEVGHHGGLVHTGLLGVREVEVVAAQTWKVREHHPWE